MSGGGIPAPGTGTATPLPALLLAAGLGTRLRPLTRLCAKPALPVAGVPLAGRILRWLSLAGVRDVVINLHHRPDTITGALGDGSAFGVRARYSWEPQILGSAGGPARALGLLDADRFLLVNGDTLTDVDLARMVDTHEATGALVTMALVPNPDREHYGGVSVDADGAIDGFPRPGPANSGLHFIGVQVVEAEVFRALATDRTSDTVGGVYDDLMIRHPGRLRGFVSQAAFRDIGTAADYLATCLETSRQSGRGDVIVEDGALVDPGASLSGTLVMARARVGAGAVLDACVVAGGADVPAGCRLSRCVLRPAQDAGERDSFEREVGALLVSPLDIRRPRPARN